jgi:hypothetical protein
VIDASAVAAGAMLLTLDGGDGDDVILGGPGGDTILGGPGSNIVLDSFRGTTLTSATFAGLDWLKTHVRTVDGTTALVVGGAVRTLPRADLSQLTADLSRL